MTYSHELTDNEVDTEVELLKRIKLSDRNAFSLIYNKYCDILFEHAYRVVREREVCMDIVQEIFTRFWTNRALLEINFLKPYLLTAVKFQIANYIRKNKIHESYIQNFIKVTSAIPATEEVSEIRELKDLISDLTGLLPEKCRHVFLLSRDEYLSNKEIASKLGISEKTVEMHITLAIKKLKAGVADYMNLLLIFF